MTIATAPAPEPTSALAAAKASRILLIVDDESHILQSLQALFQRSYRVVTCGSPLEALDLIKGGLKPQVILSDNRMPEMTGVDFLTKSSEFVPDAVRVIMTGFAEIREILIAINRGQIYMYISKPWQLAEVIHAIRICFQNHDLTALNRRLFREAESQNVELARMNEELRAVNQSFGMGGRRTMSELLRTVQALGKLVSAREDYYYHNHAESVAVLSKAIAGAVGFSDMEISIIEVAAYLHDIGKQGLPRDVRAADPEFLTGDPRALYETHVNQGLKLLDGINRFERIREIVAQHHEKVDGSGFPLGIKGRQIIPESHVVAMADIYHNMVYRLQPGEYERRLAGESVSLNAAERLRRQERAAHYFVGSKERFDVRVHSAFFQVAAAGTVPWFSLPEN